MMTDPEQALRAAIEQLYSVFAGYPLRPHVDGCAHCVTPADHERIHSKPLRELTAEDLEEYADSALFTWGDEDDFRHFLPRLFELIAFSKEPLDPESIIGRLAYAGWRSWPQAEQAAIEAYLGALWPFVLSLFPFAGLDDWTAEECLCSIAQVIDDLGPFLRYWRRSEWPSADCHLQLLIHDNAAGLLAEPRSLGNSRWGAQGHQLQMDQVIDWILEPPTGPRFEQAVRRYPEWRNEWFDDEHLPVLSQLERIWNYQVSTRPQPDHDLNHP